MKVTRFLAAIMLLGATASVSFAQGVVNFAWDGCTGPIDKTIGAGLQSGPEFKGIWISVINQVDSHKAYDVRFFMGQPGGIKDAWRFDASGCQGSGGLVIDHLSPAKTCPSFMQTSNPSLQIKDYSYDSGTGKTRGVLANSYPNGVGAGATVTPTSPATTVNPATRYFLARFNFDQEYASVGPSQPGLTCGGIESPACAHIVVGVGATWLDLNGVEHAWGAAQEYVTANDPTNSFHCPGATPTTPKTWGSLKSQYRN